MNVIEELKIEAKRLQKLAETKEEKLEKSRYANQFDERIQVMAYQTIKNLMVYQLEGWKELMLQKDGES